MQTNANEKNTVENIFAAPVWASFPEAAGTKRPFAEQRLKTSDAKTKPRMNLGNFSHTIPSEGACELPFSLRAER